MSLKKEDALNLVHLYMNGWKQNNLTLLISCLAPDCTIIESHGPMYQGVVALRRWFELWTKAKSRVKRWDIVAFYNCDSENAAFVEWNFSCVSNSVHYSFPGTSLYKFTGKKISWIHEYRMTSPATVWTGTELVSE